MRHMVAVIVTVVTEVQSVLLMYVRFVYHKLSSIKIDNKVVCPLEALDLSDYISGPVSSALVYDLQSCVCHFGGCYCSLMSFVITSTHTLNTLLIIV